MEEAKKQKDPFALYLACVSVFPDGDGDTYLGLCLKAKPDYATQVRTVFEQDQNPRFEVIDAIADELWPFWSVARIMTGPWAIPPTLDELIDFYVTRLREVDQRHREFEQSVSDYAWRDTQGIMAPVQDLVLKHTNRYEEVNKRIRLGKSVEGRDEKGIKKTVAAFLKILHPTGIPTDDEFEEYVACAIECRRRVKEQMNKRKSDDEFARIDLSFINKHDESIVTPYLAGAKTVEIEDPYIRVTHQIQNFVRFCEVVVKVPTVKKITLYTSYDEQTNMQELSDRLN